MNTWVTVLAFTYPHEAYLAKATLEAEGIHVELKDEFTAQVHNFYSDAIGGVKIQVHPSEFQRAQFLLQEAGYFQKTKEEKSPFMLKFDQITSMLPLVGKNELEIRLVFVVALILLLVAIPIVWYLVY